MSGDQQLPPPRNTRIDLEECGGCPWLDRDPPGDLEGFAASIGRTVWRQVGANYCGVCGCHVRAKKRMGGFCPLELRRRSNDPRTVQLRRLKWQALARLAQTGD